MPGPTRAIGATTTLLATMLLATGAVSAGEPVEPNHMNLVIERVADDFTPGAAFLALIEVGLPQVPGATGVLVTMPGGPVVLEQEENGHFFEEPGFGDFASMKAALDGVWTIVVTGSSPSTTTFTLDLDTLADGDLFATPTVLTPTSGATGVPSDVVFEWTDPTGPLTPDALFAEVENNDDGTYQEASNLAGTLDVTDTTWDPNDLTDGSHDLSIMYLNIVPSRISAFDVTSGTVSWGESPYAPEGYPAGTPLCVIGSETIIGFTVGVPCPGDFDGSGDVAFTDLIMLLASWGPCPGCPQDLDGNGTVAFTDLILALSHWGPCP